MRFTAKQQEAFLEHLRAGERRGAAADMLDLDRIDVRKYIESHPDFEERVQFAELDALEHVEEAIYQAAISGNVPAAKLWFERNDGAQSRLLNKPPARHEPPPRPEKDEEPEPDEEDLILNVTPIDPRRRRKRH